MAAASQAPAAVTVEPVRYQSAGREIAADLYLPARPRGLVVFAHGNRPQGRKHVLARALAAALGRHFTTLAFDFRGYGESGPLGPYRPGMTLDLTDDIIGGARLLARRFGVPIEDVILVGHSFGSGSVLLAGNKIGSRRVVALGPTEADAAFRRPDFAAIQARKLKRVGLDVPLDAVEGLYAPLRAKALFATCPTGKRLFIWGEREIGYATFAPHLARLRQSCPGVVEVAIVPFANHMYWTEGRGAWRYRLLNLFIAERDWTDAAVGAILRHLPAG